MEKITNNTADFDKLVHRMNRSLGCFFIWKYIRKSISIPENGLEETNRRTEIMNNYDGIFSVILYATENTFITDLHKFFDKSKNNLKLETLTKNLPIKKRKEIELLLKPIEKEIKRIAKLRHNFTAHEPNNPKEEKIFIDEIEKIFSIIQKVLNIISNVINRESMTWDTWEETTGKAFIRLLNDLENGLK